MLILGGKNLNFVPEKGIEKLCEKKPKLWCAFLKAKDFRGKIAHTYHKDEFNEKNKVDSRKHIKTFIQVAEWLCDKLKRDWCLSILDPDTSEALDPIP